MSGSDLISDIDVCSLCVFTGFASGLRQPGHESTIMANYTVLLQVVQLMVNQLQMLQKQLLILVHHF